MAYYLLDDQFADDVIWDALSGGSQALLDAIQAAFTRLASKSAHLLTDGYLTAELAAKYARPKVLELLTRPVLGRPPLLHKPGDECECLGDEWTEGYAYRIHKFLRRNPSRAEHNRNRQQKADLRDSRLKNLVWLRDGKCCRYCESGPLHPKSGRNKDRRKVLHFDHVDPDAPAGPAGENLVTCCARCNEHKGHRTPQEADMVLLPEPTEAERATMAGRDQAVFDLPDALANQPRDQQQISDRSPTNQRQTTDRTTDPVTDPDVGPNADLQRRRAAEERPEQAERRTDQPRPTARKGPGRGGAGAADPDPVAAPPPTPRTSADPDVYTKRSRPGPPTQAQPRTPAPAATHQRRRLSDPFDPGRLDLAHLTDDDAGWPAGARPAPRSARAAVEDR